MNAVPIAAVTATPTKGESSAGAFLMLLKREYWEHRGGFLWAPMVGGAIFLLLNFMMIVVGEVALNRGGFDMNGFSFDKITDRMSPGDLVELGAGIDMLLYSVAGLIGFVLAIVVFFYCLGALYDERRDRSVLFWKSLPISDGATVLSKVASAILVAPVIATVAALLTGLGMLVLISGVALLHGANPFTVIWAPASPFRVLVNLLFAIPVQALWALPTVGWLLLCSAWARSKPFLWAVGLPLGAGLMVSWFDLMQNLHMPDGWFWKNIVARLLLSVAPGGWLDVTRFGGMDIDGPRDLANLVNLGHIYGVLLTPQLWIGVVAGAAMIFAAIRLRRWRDDG